MIRNYIATIFVFLIFANHISGETHPPHILRKTGVSFKDGMYFCEALGSFILPYKDRLEVEMCHHATQAQEICSENPNTEWISGRCFCPELNRYLQETYKNLYSNIHNRQTPEKIQVLLENLRIAVSTCPAFEPKRYPFGRTINLVPHPNGYTAQKANPDAKWDNRDDDPGQQGNPEFPARICSILGLPLGFGYDENNNPLLLNFDKLTSDLKKVTTDVSFFEVAGELTGRRYLEEFMLNHLPIARIGNNGDAAYFLHDVNFHAMGFILLPLEIRDLAQRQTRHLLQFIDWFSIQYPQEWSLPQYKLMAQKLIEGQINRIDVATGDLTQKLFQRLTKESSAQTFIETLIQMEWQEKIKFHEQLMAITDTWSGFSEKRSVDKFLDDKKSQVLRAFDEKDKEGQETFQRALSTYIRSHQHEPGFAEEIKMDSYHDLYYHKPRFGISAVDLFVKRLRQLGVILAGPVGGQD